MDIGRRSFFRTLTAVGASLFLPDWLALLPKGRSMIAVPSTYGDFHILPYNGDDLKDVITILSPVDSPIFTYFRKNKQNIYPIQVEWITDVLDG